MPAKKAAAKKAVAAKKTAAEKPAPVKKAAAKKTAPAKKSAGPKENVAKKKAVVRPPLDAIARAAYLNYRRRVEQGLPGDSHSDWLEAERQLLGDEG
jgi:hypothetical protein